MRLAPGDDHRHDPRRLAGRRVRRTEVSVVRQQGLRLAKLGRQHRQLLDHRTSCCLSLVACTTPAPAKAGVPGHHQQAVRGNRRLGVVALLEPAAGDPHNARVLVGLVDLILRLRCVLRRRRQPTTWLASGGRRLGRTCRELGPIRACSGWNRSLPSAPRNSQSIRET